MAAIWLRPSPLSRPCGQASATGRAMSTTIDKGEPAAELVPLVFALVAFRAGVPRRAAERVAPSFV